MSDAQHLLLPYLRRGVATALTHRQDAGAAGPRAAVDVTVAFNSGADREATTSLSLFGAGDVTGFDARAVIRTSPAANDYDAESNYFPLVEFDQPDLPWRLTPAAPTADDRLTPWIALVTLTDAEILDRRAASSDAPFEAIQVDAASLPAIGQAWAWAHAQITGMESTDAGDVWDVIDTDPTRATARLLSPRRLEVNTGYTAFIVPTFERGRLRGLGEEPDTSVDGLQPGWADGDTSVWLPVYFSWRFQTGQAGDFEYLVRRLTPATLPADVGTRALDVSDPGLGLPGASSAPLTLPGALQSPAAAAATWDAGERATFEADLSSLLNAPADLLAGGTNDRTIAPPLYGRWHALAERVDGASSRPWFGSLNLDPTRRVLAGAGTRVVQAEQSGLLASAWSQVSRIRELIETMRLAQLAREAAQGLHLRAVARLGTQQIMWMAAPVATRITTSPTTVASALRSSPLPSAITSPAFRRIVRRRGPLARRLGRAPVSGRLLDRANRGEITPNPKPEPGRLATRGEVLTHTTPGGSGTSAERGCLPIVVSLLWLLLGAVLAVAIRVFAGAPRLLSLLVLAAAWVAARRTRRIIGGSSGGSGGGATVSPDATTEEVDRAIGDAVATATPARGWVPVSTSPTDPRIVLPTPTVGAAAAAASVEAFRDAATALLATAGTPPAAGAVRTVVDLDSLARRMTVALEPRTTVAAGPLARLLTIPGVLRAAPDPIEPVMPYPVFDEPMYAPLARLGKEWLVPGFGSVPANSVSLLATNQAVVEAYLAGLNHEMARELRYHEYPTDQRGTYFRRFWDTRTSDADPADTYDITEMHTWTAGDLGAHAAHAAPPGGEHLVLLVRGDLIRRYPNLIVTAVEAEDTRGLGARTLGATELEPAFTGSLPPDAAFFGFALTADQVTGADGGAGWFFVLEEQPSEPRFGLDIEGPATISAWDDLAWTHVDAAARYIDLDADQPDTRGVARSGGAAWHADAGLGATGARASDIAYITLQRPYRVAVHGSRMIEDGA